FPRYLLERREKLPEAWKPSCIDYETLKSHIKKHVKPHGTPSPAAATLSFSDSVGSRLGYLQNAVSAFFALLDVDVDRLVAFYLEECSRLSMRFELRENSATTADAAAMQLLYGSARTLLQDVVKLERFIFLNYTGITKILKKNDRHSGLRLSEPYVFRLTSLPFYRSTLLASLKKRLIEQVSGTPQSPTGVLTPQSPIMTDGNPFFSAATQAARTSAPKGSWLPPASVAPSQKVLVTMSGPHGTDIIGAVLDSIARYDCHIDDFALSRLYHNVTFGCLITLASDSVDIFRDLAEAAAKWDATLLFDVQDPKDLPASSLEDAPYRDRAKYTATVLNQNGLSSRFLNDWTRLLLDEKISVEKMSRLSAQDGSLASIDFRLSVPLDVDFDKLRAELFSLSMNHHTDVALQPNDVFRKSKRLVIFDMDSTLIQQEVIDEIAKHAGVVGEVARITESAMNGEIDFKDSLRQRVGLLKGTSVNVLELVKAQLTFTDGAHFLCKALKRLGFKLAVISGGFMPLALYVKHHLGLDYAFANQVRL
ncbi:hypothetical protein BDK51DRAFT_13715, partial [Blyttiomyces helicus]